MTAERLTRMNANGVAIGHIPGGSCEISPTEMAYCLSGLKPAIASLAYLKICGWEGERHSVWSGLIDKAFASEFYTDQHKPTIQLLCHQAITEHTESTGCPQCNGSGKVGKNYAQCGLCLGTGQKPSSIRSRMAAIGKKHSSWYIYRDLHGYLMEVLHSWDDEIIRRVRRRAG